MREGLGIIGVHQQKSAPGSLSFGGLALLLQEVCGLALIDMAWQSLGQATDSHQSERYFADDFELRERIHAVSICILACGEGCAQHPDSPERKERARQSLLCRAQVREALQIRIGTFRLTPASEGQSRW